MGPARLSVAMGGVGLGKVCGKWVWDDMNGVWISIRDGIGWGGGVRWVRIWRSMGVG